MSKYNILIVEDEIIAANYLKKILEKSGHRVVGIADSRESAMRYTYKDSVAVDLVLMDIKIKGKEDGITLAREMQSYLPIAVLFISAYSDRDYLERAKDIDVIGYLVKPIQHTTLLSTIEVGMAHFKANNSKSIIPLCDKIVFDIQHQLIEGETEHIELSQQESIVLKTLLLNKPNLTTIEELEDELFSCNVSGEGALRTTIWRLRKKLPQCLSIETVYKSGYKIKY
jgi:DNA-binding response OmpR family regulator